MNWAIVMENRGERKTVLYIGSYAGAIDWARAILPGWVVVSCHHPKNDDPPAVKI